jgi:hypothetical protein
MRFPLLYVLLSAIPCFALADHVPGIQEIIVPFHELSRRQQELLATFQKSEGFEGTAEQFWDELGKDNSIQRTFFYTTEAMERRHVKNGQTVLDQIESIEDVAGSMPGKHSAEQFNIKVKWKAPAGGNKAMKDQFKTKGWTDRFSSDHPGEFGIQEKNKGYRGLHLLFSKDTNEGHVHVDFRGTNWFEAMMTKLRLKFLVPPGLKKGHFDARNADIGAIGPEKEGGVPISNLDWFVQNYNDPRVANFSENAPAVNLAMDKILPGQPLVTGNGDHGHAEMHEAAAAEIAL